MGTLRVNNVDSQNDGMKFGLKCSQAPVPVQHAKINGCCFDPSPEAMSDRRASQGQPKSRADDLADKNADSKREAPPSSECRFVDLLLCLSATLPAWKTQADDPRLTLLLLRGFKILRCRTCGLNMHRKIPNLHSFRYCATV